MNRALLDRIAPVTIRLRSVRFWRIIAIFAILSGAYAMVVQSVAEFPSLESGGLTGWRFALSVGCGFTAAALVAWILCRLSFRNPFQVANLIEARFPSLQQRLLTALQQQDDKLGFLQQRVIKEARDHSHANHWSEVVPMSQLFWSRLLGILAVAFLAFVLGQITLLNPSDRLAQSQRSALDANITVEPGDTEVERGTSMVVTARFADSEVPETAKLVCLGDDGGERTIPMTRNLSDPVVGGFLSSVKADFRYKIVTPTWESDTFTVSVFDYPALVRSDADLDYPQLYRFAAEAYRGHGTGFCNRGNASHLALLFEQRRHQG